jgi:hypothetical protein
MLRFTVTNRLSTKVSEVKPACHAATCNVEVGLTVKQVKREQIGFEMHFKLLLVTVRLRLIFNLTVSKVNCKAKSQG